MTTITKERLLTIKQWRETYGPGSNVVLPAEEAEELARIALASLAAVSDERAAYELFMEKRFGESVDRRRAKNGDREYMAWDMALGWIIWCHRAAMLHCAEPASKHEELPLDYLQGQKDGLEWAAQLAEANHPQTGDWLYDDPVELAKAIRKGPDMPEAAGNSPVTPDGWISCSERMPNDAQWCVVDAADGYYVQCWSEGQGWLGDDISLRNCDVIRWMALPEPPQEMK